VVLTIDETIQFIAEKALDKAFVKYNAAAASIIVLDPKTGEVAGFRQPPDFPARPRPKRARRRIGPIARWRSFMSRARYSRS